MELGGGEEDISICALHPSREHLAEREGGKPLLLSPSSAAAGTREIIPIFRSPFAPNAAAAAAAAAFYWGAGWGWGKERSSSISLPGHVRWEHPRGGSRGWKNERRPCAVSIWNPKPLPIKKGVVLILVV